MPRRTWLGFIIVLLVNYLVFRFVFPNQQSAKVPYSVLQRCKRRRGTSRASTVGATASPGRFKAPVRYPTKAGFDHEPRQASRRHGFHDDDSHLRGSPTSSRSSSRMGR